MPAGHVGIWLWAVVSARLLRGRNGLTVQERRWVSVTHSCPSSAGQPQASTNACHYHPMPQGRSLCRPRQGGDSSLPQRGGQTPAGRPRPGQPRAAAVGLPTHSPTHLHYMMVFQKSHRGQWASVQPVPPRGSPEHGHGGRDILGDQEGPGSCRWEDEAGPLHLASWARGGGGKGSLRGGGTQSFLAGRLLAAVEPPRKRAWVCVLACGFSLLGGSGSTKCLAGQPATRLEPQAPGFGLAWS